MPVVVVEMWQGRNDEQKEKLIKEMTKAFEAVGVKKESLTIILHESPKSNWGVHGEQASKATP